MSEAPQHIVVPQWTLGDRMGKALSVAGIGVGEISAYLGLSRNSVSAYINDRQAPKRQTLLLWSMRTGVSMEWLEGGVSPETTPEPPKPGKRDDSALQALIEEKKSRSRSSGTNRRYFGGSLVPAVRAA